MGLMATARCWKANTESTRLHKPNGSRTMSLMVRDGFAQSAILRWVPSMTGLLKIGDGALCNFDFVPSDIVPSYSSDPHGITGFVRLATRNFAYSATVSFALL